MFRVYEFMSDNPITIEPSETISDALDLMKFKGIHRIPVVDANNQLKGLITEGMVTGAKRMPTSLSIHELNYLLSKTQVKTIMETNPVTIGQNALMEEAIELLHENNIGCLPVVDEQGKVVGILTQNDLYKAFLEMFGWRHKGSRLELRLNHELGVLEGLTDLFAENDINIRNISVYKIDEGKARVVIKTENLIPDSFVELLKASNYEIRDLLHFDRTLK